MKKIILAMMSFILVACSHTEVSSSSSHKENIANKKVSANYNLQLGMGYLAKGNTERAKDKLLRALAQAPDWPPVLDAMGYYSEKTGDIVTAKKYYERALNVAPDNGMAQNNYGTFLCRHQLYKEADEHFLRAVNDPSYISVADAYENAGLCAMQSGHHRSAEAYLKKALLHDPLRTSTLIELSTFYYKSGNYRLAQGYLQMIKSSELNSQTRMLSMRIAQKKR